MEISRIFIKNTFFYYRGMLLIFLIFISSKCSTDVEKEEKKLIGAWSISEIYEGDKNLIYYITPNLLTFKEDKSCGFPAMRNFENGYVMGKGKWEYLIKDSAHYLKIDINNHLLSGMYKVDFSKNYEKQMFQMTLVKDSLHIIAVKGMTHINEFDEK